MDAQPVKIIDQEKPVTVEIQEPGKEPPVLVKKVDAQTLAPTTTDQQDKTKAGQRRVNLIWEFTQGLIALIITTSIVYCAVNKIESQAITNAFFLIVSMYFVRTNHQLIGGTGEKPLNQTR